MLIRTFQVGFVVLGLVSLAGCQIVAPPAAAGTGEQKVAAAEPAVVCPSDLSVVDQGALLLETDPSRDGAAYAAMHFAPDHRKPVLGDATFSLGGAEAIDKVVALEEKSPNTVPAGFREELAAHRRDPAFRLRMATCELDQRTLQRRAAIDLGMALLLGADAATVTAKANNLSEPLECRKDVPGGEMACMRARGEWHEWRATTKVSATELELEDAISRGLASLPRTSDEVHSTTGTILFRLAHKCASGGVCLSRADKVGDATRFVHWDRRDGGAHHDMAPSAATAKSNKRCKDATGWEGQEACLQGCWSGGRSGADGATCRTRCLAFCDPH